MTKYFKKYKDDGILKKKKKECWTFSCKILKMGSSKQFGIAISWY